MSPRACLAVVAGSGMSGVADGFAVESTTPFDAIEGVGPCTVAGHRGEVRWCRRGNRRFAVVLGRRHLYEREPVAMQRLIAWLGERGVTALVVASAAGSLTRHAVPGELVVVRDALDFQNRDRFTSPAWRRGNLQRARALNEADALRPGGRIAVDPDLTHALETACRAAGVRAGRGVLACFSGPTYETPAEVEFAGFTGAALVTMSAAPEMAFAAALGMPVAAFAAITNFATGIGHARPDHAEVVEMAGRASAGLARVIAQLVDKYGVGPDYPNGG